MNILVLERGKRIEFDLRIHRNVGVTRHPRCGGRAESSCRADGGQGRRRARPDGNETPANVYAVGYAPSVQRALLDIVFMGWLAFIASRDDSSTSKDRQKF